MKGLYKNLILFGMVLFVTNVMAQRTVLIEPSDDPLVPLNIVPVIMGDTTDAGERMDNNTIYQLVNGQVYVTSGTIINKPEWKLHIEAQDLDDLVSKPVITRVPNADGGYQAVMNPEGDVTLRNLWIISGETGVDQQQSWGQMRYFGTGSTVKIDDCIIEKDRGGFVQLRADSMKIYINNSIFRNGGNRFILEGNGRGIDTRQFAVDSLVVKNTVIHNIVDRVFRSLGNTQPHNYIEFDHCTIFNVVGRHGCFVFEQVRTAKVTNNQIINPMMLGSSPRYTDEQNNPDNDAMKVFTVDTLYDDTEFIISNNNITYSQDVLDVWAKHDTVSKPDVYSTLIAERMGTDTADSYIQEAITLNAVPMNITQYVDDLLANPAAEDMFDFVAEDISRAGTEFDNGNIFDFATFDPCYDVGSTESGSYSTTGGPIGVLTFCDLSTSVFEDAIDANLSLTLAPNPVKSFAVFRYDLENSSRVRLSIYDIMGREIQVVTDTEQIAGPQQIDWNPGSRLSPGLYIARLTTEHGQMSLKVNMQ